MSIALRALSAAILAACPILALAGAPEGADGRAAIGEDQVQARLAYGMPDVLGTDRARYAGRIVAVAGAGHSAYFEQPEEWNRVVLDFLARVGGSPGFAVER